MTLRSAMRTSFVHLWVPFAIATSAVCAAACSDATGSLVGGQALSLGGGADDAGTSEPPGCPPSGTPTFSALYSCYFTACGTMGCHGTSIDDGSLSSGFVCGATASSCAMGLMTSTMSIFQPPVPAGGAADATTTVLYGALYKGGMMGGTSNNMPLTPTYEFTAADLAAIEAWIQNGAPNN